MERLPFQVAPSAKETVRKFEDFPGSKLDDLSDDLATGARIKWPPVNAEESESSPLPATSSQKAKRQRQTTSSLATKPKAKKPRLKPVAGTYWRANGGGYELRKSGSGDDPDKDKYLGYLNGKDYAKMKAEHSGDELTAALTRWVQAKAATKGIHLN